MDLINAANRRVVPEELTHFEWSSKFEGRLVNRSRGQTATQLVGFKHFQIGELCCLLNAGVCRSDYNPWLPINWLSEIRNRNLWIYHLIFIIPFIVLFYRFFLSPILSLLTFFLANLICSIVWQLENYGWLPSGWQSFRYLWKCLIGLFGYLFVVNIVWRTHLPDAFCLFWSSSKLERSNWANKK